MHKETDVTDELFNKCSEIYTILTSKGKLDCTFEEFKNMIQEGESLRYEVEKFLKEQGIDD